MPAFGNRIPKDQIWALAAYVRSMAGLAPQDAAPNRDDAFLTRTPESFMTSFTFFCAIVLADAFFAAPFAALFFAALFFAALFFGAVLRALVPLLFVVLSVVIATPLRCSGRTD